MPVLFRCFGLLLLCAVPAFAQFSANIQGKITDSSGALVANAVVTATNTDTGIVSHVTSNSSGQYHINSLAPGRYIVHVEAAGFRTTDVPTQITTQQEAGVNVVLGLAENSQAVTVSAETEGDINPAETRVQATLNTQQVRDLPLQSRGTLNLVNTAPGVSGYSEGLNNFAVEQTPGGSANGHYYGGNLYVLDGVSITSNITTGTGNISPNADSLQEIALQANTFHMDFSGGSGVTTELTTKSGANKFHGTANYTYTDQHLRVYSEFVHKYSKFSNKDVSATFGGPILKERTFFFGSFEKQNNKVTGTNQFAVEDPAFVAYAKTAFPNSIGTSFLTKYPITNVNRSGVQLYATPNFAITCVTPTGNCTTPFIDSASSSSSPYSNGLQYSVRADQYFRDGKDRVYGYYYNIKLDTQEINPRPGFNQVDTNRSWFTSVNYTHVFSSNLLNQAQFAVYKVEGALPGSDPTVPFIHINNAQSVTGFGGGWGPGSFIQHNYSWRDVVSYVRGNHSLKFGVEANKGDDSADFGPVQARPQFGFNSLTEFIQDKVYDEGGLSFDPLTGQFKPLQFGAQVATIGGFIEDQWKVTSNFSLTLGIRYDNFGNPTTYGYDSYNKFANVYISGNSTSLAQGTALDAQFADASVKQNDHLYPKSQSFNVTPRVAFAWQPTASGKISVHGGIGMYRDEVTLGQVVDGLRGNPPGWISPYFSPTQPIQAIFSVGNSQKSPFGYVYPTLPATGLDSHGGVPGAGAGITGIDPNVRIPKTLNYTLGVTTELPGHFVFGINGVGSSAYDQLSGTDFNRSAGDLIRNNGKLLRLNPSFSSINYVSNLTHSNYYGLIFTLTQRLRNLNYQTSYTWSRAKDEGTCATRFDYNGGLDCPGDQHNFAANYGPSSFDVRQNFKLSGSYTVPTPHFEAVVNHVLGGWELSSIATAQTGTPFTAVNYNNFDPTCTGRLVTCGDYNADGYNNDRPNVGSGQTGGFTRKQYIAGVFPIVGGQPTNFSAPTAGALGNEGRNIYRNPGLLVVDASVIKNNAFPWFGGESSNLQVRVDFFNALNRVNLRTVDYNVGSTTFGRSQDTFQPRVIQLGARFQF